MGAKTITWLKSLLNHQQHATSSFSTPMLLKCGVPKQTKGTMDYLFSDFSKDPRLFYHGMLPFHCACCAGATLFFLKWWSKKCLDIVQAITADTSNTVLHCYLLSPQAAHNRMKSHSQRQWYFLAAQVLVGKYPDALHKINRMGMLLFHVAAVHDAPLDVLFFFACQNPEVLLTGHSNLVVSDCAHEQVGRKRKFCQCWPFCNKMVRKITVKS